jgi:O-antigen/teichoic acid export membrane protein
LRKEISKFNLLQEGSWVVFGQLIIASGTLIGVRLLTEIVPKNIYGTVSLLIGLITLGTNVFISPLMLSAQRFYSEIVIDSNVSSLRNTIIKLLRFTVTLLVCLILLVGIYFNREKNIPFIVFLLLAGFAVVQVCGNLEVNLFIAARRQRECAIWKGSEAWLKPLLAALIVWVLGTKTESILLGYLLASCLILFAFRVSSVKLEGLGSQTDNVILDAKTIKNILHYALPIIPLALVGWVILLSDRYIIGGLLGANEVGIYAATYGLVGTPFLLVGGAVSQTLRPAFYQAVSNNQKAVERKILSLWFVVTFSICGIGVLAVFFLRKWIVFFLLAKEYRSGEILMPWIAAGIALQVVSQVFESIFFGHKKTHYVLLVHSAGAVVCVVTVFIMISKYGLIGAAMACPIYYSSMTVLSFILLRKFRNRR